MPPTNTKVLNIKKAENMSSAALDAQETLTVENLKKLTSKLTKEQSFVLSKDRPKESLINLISWTENNFLKFLPSKNNNIHRLINNKILIDGEFLHFTEQTKTKIETIFSDGIVSWKSDFENEKFFAQGVFLIKTNKCQFLHCALYHKGNQNEDEVSFFVLVDDDNYQEYIKFRNDFDTWSVKRDRANLQIRVVDGDDIPYERDNNWDDVFLPEELKTNIKNSVEGFLKSKEIYSSRKIPWKRGIILWGEPGGGKTTLIKTLISNYDFKPITVLPGADDHCFRDAFAYAEEQSPSLLYFEDLDSLLQNVNISLFLNLMDGVQAKNGLLIVATANNLGALKSNIKDRPSRFDRKFEIPYPTEAMAFKYLKKWFENTISDKELKTLSSFSVKYNFSYAYIKELYISSMYNAISENRTKPTLKDVSTALKQLMDDKFNKNRVVGFDKYIKAKK